MPRSPSRPVAIYVRTSTADQDGAAQRFQLRGAAAIQGTRSPREYLDLGHTGSHTSRPALEQLRRDVATGAVRVVIISGLDRLARSLVDLLRLFEEFEAAGCALVSLREHIDLGTSTGRLVAHIFGALAEFERALIAERRDLGIARARAEGTRSGKPFGRPRRAVDLERVIELRAEGRSWRRVAESLHCPRRTLERAYKLHLAVTGAKASPRKPSHRSQSGATLAR